MAPSAHQASLRQRSQEGRGGGNPGAHSSSSVCHGPSGLSSNSESRGAWGWGGRRAPSKRSSLPAESSKRCWQTEHAKRCYNSSTNCGRGALRPNCSAQAADGQLMLTGLPSKDAEGFFTASKLRRIDRARKVADLVRYWRLLLANCTLSDNPFREVTGTART